MYTRCPIFTVALLALACRSDPAPATSSAICSVTRLERAAAELRALPPERAGDRERLVLEALHSGCSVVPNRFSLVVARSGGEYVSQLHYTAAMYWEISSDERQAPVFSKTPEFAALAGELGWNAEVTRSFIQGHRALATIGVDLLLRDSGLRTRDRQTIVWAAYAHLGRAANVWPRVELARVLVRGVESAFYNSFSEPTHVHIASEGWSIGAWKPEPSRWLPVHENWREPQVSLGPPPTAIDLPKQGFVQLFVAADVSVGDLRPFIDAIPVPNCDRLGPCSPFVRVDFVVVSEYHSPEFPQVVTLPIYTSSLPPDCGDPARECVVNLPVREAELGDEQFEPHALNRIADVVVVDEQALEVWSAEGPTRIGLVAEGPLRESLEPVFNDRAEATGARPAIAIISRPDVPWQSIATIIGALQGPECDEWHVDARGCRFKQVALWVSE